MNDKGTISTPKPTAPEMPSFAEQNMSLFHQAPVIAIAVPETEDQAIALPVMIAVKKQQNIVINTDSQTKRTIKVSAIGHNEQKQFFTNAIGRSEATEAYLSTIGMDFSITKTEMARYQAYNLSNQSNYRTIHRSYIKDSGIILLFGQNEIQTAISVIPTDLRDQFDFYATRYNTENKFEMIPDLSNATPDHLETQFITKYDIDAFLDAALQTMRLTYHVTAVPLQEDSNNETTFETVSRFLGY